MVYKGSCIGILDNTGIKTVKILQVYSYSNARVGDILLAVLRKKKKIKTLCKKENTFYLSSFS
jgi:ribosomal protein L14